MKDNRLLSVNFHHEIFTIYKSTRRDIMMEVNYRIKYVTSIRDKDLTNALDIYIHSIDEQSDTSTSEIRAYIQDKYQEERQMFFSFQSLLYDFKFIFCGFYAKKSYNIPHRRQNKRKKENPHEFSFFRKSSKNYLFKINLVNSTGSTIFPSL